MNQHTVIPDEFRDRIKWGMYDGVRQYYQTSVDGTLAQIGKVLPRDIGKRIRTADRNNRRLYVNFKKERGL